MLSTMARSPYAVGMKKHFLRFFPVGVVLAGVLVVWSGCEQAGQVQQQGAEQPSDKVQDYVVVSAGDMPAPPNTGTILADTFDAFDVRNPSPWTVDFADGVLTPHEGQRGRIVVFEGLGEQWVRLSRGLEVSKLHNRLLVVSVQTRFTPSAGPLPDGASSPTGKIQLDVGEGPPLVWPIPPSSGWVDTRAVFYVPESATRCDLSIGLDKMAGTLAINDLSLAELDPLPFCGWRDGRTPPKPGVRENLLVSGDFEAGLKNFSVAAWKKVGPSRRRVLETYTLDGDAPLGSRCLRVNSAEGVVGLSSNWLALSPRQAYTLSFYAKATGKLKLRADLVAADGTRLGQTVKLTTHWQRYVVHIPADWAENCNALPPLDLYHLQLSSTGSDWPSGSSLYLDGLMLEAGDGPAPPFVDAEAIPMTLALGRERQNDLSNLFDTTEPLTAGVTVFNPLPIPATVQIKLEVHDGFERSVFSEVKNAEIPARARRQADFVLKLSRGWYRVSAQVVPPAGLFGNVPNSSDAKIAAVLTPRQSALAGAGEKTISPFGLQLGDSASPDLALLGIGWVRYAPEWKQVETARRQYDFAPCLSALAEAKRAGLDVLAVLGPRIRAESVPACYLPDSSATQPVALPAAARTPFSDYVGRWVKTLAGKGVTAYQVLDGANRDLSASDYLALYKLASIQVQAHQPAAQTLPDAGVLAGAGDPLAFVREGLSIEPSLAEQPMTVRFAEESDLDPEAILPILEHLMELKRTYGIPELWDVRFAPAGPSAYRQTLPVGKLCSTGVPPVPADPVAATATDQAALVARGTLLRLGMGLSRVAWTARTSGDVTWAEPLHGATICEPDGTLRPATVAYQFLAERLTGAKALGVRKIKAEDGATAWAALFERPDKSVLVALWQPQPRQRCIFALPASAGVTVCNLFGTPLAAKPGKLGYRLELGPAPLYLQADAEHAGKLLEVIR